MSLVIDVDAHFEPGPQWLAHYQTLPLGCPSSMTAPLRSRSSAAT